MEIQAVRAGVLEVEADVLAVGVWEGAPLGGAAAQVDAALNGAIGKLIGRGEFSGRAYETAPLLVPVGRSGQVLLVGLGRQDKFNAGAAYRTAAAAARTSKVNAARRRRRSAPGSLAVPDQAERPRQSRVKSSSNGRSPMKARTDLRIDESAASGWVSGLTASMTRTDS